MFKDPFAYQNFQIGDYKITIVPVGKFALDGGAMFGVVPKALWNKLLPCDPQNRVPLALNCLLIEYQNEKCLLDTGVGNKFSPKHREMYGIEAEYTIEDALGTLGVKTAEITKLLFTHLHFDHAGGATKFDATGKLVSTFENAEFIVHQGEWEDAIHPGPKSKASYLPENLQPLESSGRLKLLEGSKNEVLPGLSLQITGGHTRYHQVLILDSPEGGFIYWGDLIPTSHHLKIPYVMAYDLYPVETMQMKETLLQEAYTQNWINFFEHDLEVPACQLAFDSEKAFYYAKSDSVATIGAS